MCFSKSVNGDVVNSFNHAGILSHVDWSERKNLERIAGLKMIYGDSY